MRVAGLQTDIAWEDPKENFARAGRMLETAARGGVRLAALPEMFATGFSMDAVRVAGFADDTRQFLADAARARGLWVLGGFALPGEGRPTNACALYDPDGAERLLYRKLHPFSLAREDEHFGAGDDVYTAAVEGLRVTPLICYDLRFAEPFRLAATGTDLFVVIANWPVQRSAAWRALLAARAIENQAFVLGVNRVGEGDGHHYRGDTSLFDPMGELTATAVGDAAVVTGEASAEEVRAVREKLSFLADRRPEVYEAIRQRRREG